VASSTILVADVEYFRRVGEWEDISLIVRCITPPADAGLFCPHDLFHVNETCSSMELGPFKFLTEHVTTMQTSRPVVWPVWSTLREGHVAITDTAPGVLQLFRVSTTSQGASSRRLATVTSCRLFEVRTRSNVGAKVQGRAECGDSEWVSALGDVGGPQHYEIVIASWSTKPGHHGATITPSFPKRPSSTSPTTARSHLSTTITTRFSLQSNGRCFQTAPFLPCS
jgi:hypothetical protein